MKGFSSEIFKTDQLSCGCSSEDGDTLLWEGRKCWYPERHNSRSIHPSTQATSNIELKTSKNISTDSTLLVENSFSTACGEKKVYKISILDRKSFNFESFILSPTPFASPPFSRDAHVVFAHAAAWPHFCWSRILIWKTFEELSDEQRHSWIWYASYHQLPGPWKHPFINGWQSIRWWTKYLHSKWFFNQKSIEKIVVKSTRWVWYVFGHCFNPLHFTFFYRNSRYLEFWFLKPGSRKIFFG